MRDYEELAKKFHEEVHGKIDDEFIGAVSRFMDTHGLKEIHRASDDEMLLLTLGNVDEEECILFCVDRTNDRKGFIAKVSKEKAKGFFEEVGKSYTMIE